MKNISHKYNIQKYLHLYKIVNTQFIIVVPDHLVLKHKMHFIEDKQWWGEQDGTIY